MHTHETTEAFESSRNADRGVDFDEDSFCCVNVDLKASGLIHR